MTRKNILIASLILVFISASAVADDTEGDYHKNAQRLSDSTLKGLKGVYVLIESLPPSLIEHGLTKEQIQTDTEIRLRTAGIVIRTREEHFKEPGMPSLYIAVQAHHQPKWGVFSFSIHVELQQWVLLARNPAVGISATTWEKGATGIVGEDEVQGIRDPIKDYVDKFINAYLTENPKK